MTWYTSEPQSINSQTVSVIIPVVRNVEVDQLTGFIEHQKRTSFDSSLGNRMPSWVKDSGGTDISKPNVIERRP